MAQQGLTANGPLPSSATFMVDSAEEIGFIFERMYATQLGKKYLVELTTPIGNGRRAQNVTRYWTLTPAFIERFVNGYEEEESEESGYSHTNSDYEAAESLVQTASGPMTLSIHEVEEPTNWRRPSGEFFKHWIDFNVIGCDKFAQHILPILEKIQVYPRDTTAENYTTPCLINAMWQLGIDGRIIDSVKRRFMRSRVSRCKVKELLEGEEGIQIQIRTLGDKNLLKYGKGNKVYKIGLIDEHYIPILQTDIASYAIKNYKKLMHKERWWEFHRDNERLGSNKGVDTWALLKLLREVPGLLKPLCLSDERVYRHLTWRQMDKTNFAELHEPLSPAQAKDQQGHAECRLKHRAIEGSVGNDFGQRIVWRSRDRRLEALVGKVGSGGTEDHLRPPFHTIWLWRQHDTPFLPSVQHIFYY